MKKLLLVLILLVTVSGYAQKTKTLNINNGTVSTEIDTVSRSYLSNCNTLADFIRQNYHFTVWADDTLEVADNINFTNSIVINTNMSYSTQFPYNINFQNNLYIRRKGTTGTVNYLLYLAGD